MAEPPISIDEVARSIGNQHFQFKAFYANGDMAIHSWTKGRHSFCMELDAYRSLLRKGHYAKVIVWSTEKPTLRWDLTQTDGGRSNQHDEP
jgi:hypothetical protein